MFKRGTFLMHTMNTEGHAPWQFKMSEVVKSSGLAIDVFCRILLFCFPGSEFRRIWLFGGCLGHQKLSCDTVVTFIFRDMYILWCLVNDCIFILLLKKQLVLIQTKQYFTYQNSVISLSCNCILKSLHLLGILLGELKYLSYCINS